MKKRVIGTIVASAVTFVWMILLCYVVVLYYGTSTYGIIPYTFSNLMSACAISFLFIEVYEKFYKEDTSWFKYIFASIFLTLSVVLVFMYRLQNIQSRIIVAIVSLILSMPFIWLRGYYSKINSEKAVRIKSKIDASFAANFVSVLTIALIVVVNFAVSSNILHNILYIIGVVVTVIGGVLFLSVCESRKAGKGVIKYVQWFFSQFFVLFYIFQLIYYVDDISFPLLITAIFMAFSLIPVIVCLITELKGKSLTKAIVADIKPQGDRVKPERLTEVRRTARSRLGGRIFAGGWLMMMLIGIVYSALSGFVAFTVIGAILVVGPITYGLAKAEMNVVTGKKEQADLADLFSGFSENFSQAVVLKLLQDIFLGLWSMLFIIPGVVKSYSYAMSFYVQQQAENKNWRYALRESNRLMYGNRFKLFLLDLSFIGWYILGSMCFGIGVLFVTPYHRTARAAFFNSLLVADKKMKEEKLNAEAVTVAETEFAALTDTVASNESEETA